MSYTIKLSDGTILSGLELSGNNYISKHAVSEATFAGKLGHVEISYSGDDEFPAKTESYDHMRLASVKNYGVKGYYFVLEEIPRAELEQLKLAGKIEYLAMMSDIDMEE